MVVFRYGRLRLYLLKLLEDGPKHGYELIRLLESRFLGAYAPSAGTVYPRLQRLEAEGHVTHSIEGGRKVYALTGAGRAELRERGGELAALESDITTCVRDLTGGEPARAVSTGNRAVSTGNQAASAGRATTARRATTAVPARPPRPGGLDAAALVDRQLSDFTAHVRRVLREARAGGADAAAVTAALETSLDSAIRTLRRALS
jgi:DNA-binding PadR family transcriptional regulator